jgi:toluene monooxygenase system ferredoxin subunit
MAAVFALFRRCVRICRSRWSVIANCALTCTKHLWSWDLSSLDMLGETERPLQTYEVKLENGDILAFIDKELVYEFEDEDDMKDDDFFSKA